VVILEKCADTYGMIINRKMAYHNNYQTPRQARGVW
jgi:hypothetical protein